MATPIDADRDIQPYTALLYDALRARGVRVEPFDPVAAARRPPDVIHLHWPEYALSRVGPRGALRVTRMLACIALARRRGTRLVYTAHNARPHEGRTWLGRFFFGRFDALVDTTILLSAAGEKEVLEARPGLRGSRRVHVPHGDLGIAYPKPPPQATARRELGLPESGRVVAFVGQVRAYKGVPDLVEAMRGVEGHLVVAGRCNDPALRERLEKEAAGGRVVLRLQKLTAEEMIGVLAAADVVALPYRRVLNSGSALLALACRRPVLVPDTPTFRELATEVGEAWVERFQGGRVVAADLSAALEKVREGRPDLSAHDWDQVARLTVEAYQSAGSG